MKYLLSFILIFLFQSHSYSAINLPTAVHGEDDRVDLYEVKNPLVLRVQKSVAAMITKDRIKSDGRLSGFSISKKLCPGQKFYNQKSIAKCTGFLVSKNLIVTAAHCIKTKDFCDKYKWVFDYTQNSKSQSSYRVKQGNIFSCKRVVERKLSGFGAIDFAVIELDRDVDHRDPLEFRRKGILDESDKLILLGHASGLPIKIVEGGNILKNNHDTYFETDLDSFGGNSGAPIINSRTGLVEGIQTRGHAGYTRAPGKSCKVPIICKPGECHTSKGVRITEVETIQNL